MKKGIVFLLCIVAAVYFSMPGGNVENVQIIEVDSEIYSPDDIDTAIKTVIRKFGRNWKGCTLRQIYYVGDEAVPGYQDWADRNNADEVIVLTSSFDVDSSGGDGSLEPGSTYKNWKWILVRSGKGRWKQVDYGY